MTTNKRISIESKIIYEHKVTAGLQKDKANSKK